MKIEVDKLKTTDYNFESTPEKNTLKSFASILKAEKSEAEKKEKEIVSKKLSESNNVKVFNNILNVDEPKGRNMYLKDNGKIDVMKMLKEYGNDVKTKDLNTLASVIGALYKEGLIDDEDYFNALKWIRTKIMEKSIEININKKEYEIIESLDKE